MRHRPYHLAPAVAAFLLFLAAGSFLVGRIAGGEDDLTPLQEMQAVQYAVALPARPPLELTPLVLEDLLTRLDPAFGPIAGRVIVVSYEAGEDGFKIRATHAADPGRTWTVDLRGVR